MQRPWDGDKMGLFKGQKEGSYRVMKSWVRTLDFVLNATGSHQLFKQMCDMTWTQGLYKPKCQDLAAFQELTLAAGRELIVWERADIKVGGHVGGYCSLPGGHWWQFENSLPMSLIP